METDEKLEGSNRGTDEKLEETDGSYEAEGREGLAVQLC